VDKTEIKRRLENLAEEVDCLADEVEGDAIVDHDTEVEAEELAAENMHLRAENEILKQRVASLEHELAERGPRQPQFVSSTPLTQPGGRTAGGTGGLFG